jgi:hypothetical protein
MNDCKPKVTGETFAAAIFKKWFRCVSVRTKANIENFNLSKSLTKEHMAWLLNTSQTHHNEIPFLYSWA